MNDINFLPESYVRGEARRRRIYRQVTLVAILGLSLAGWWLTQHGRTEALRSYAEALEADVRTARDQMSEITKLRQEHEQLKHQVQIQRELAQPVSHTQIVAALGELLPASVGLMQVRMVARRPPPTVAQKATASPSKKQSAKTSAPPKAEDALRLELVAVAPDDITVANLVGSLSEHPLFTQVSLRYSRAKEFQGLLGREFHVQLSVPLDRQYEVQSTVEELAHAN
jgi:Tfp pilus assembly protein PilN